MDDKRIMPWLLRLWGWVVVRYSRPSQIARDPSADLQGNSGGGQLEKVTGREPTALGAPKIGKIANIHRFVDLPSFI